MNDLLERFFRHLADEREVSEHTLGAYRRDLEAFARFLKDDAASGDDVGGALLRVDRIVLRRYLALLHKSHRKSSIARKLSALRTFYKFLMREGVLEVNPGELDGTPRREKNLPKTNSHDQAWALM